MDEQVPGREHHSLEEGIGIFFEIEAHLGVGGDQHPVASRIDAVTLIVFDPAVGAEEDAVVGQDSTAQVDIIEKHGELGIESSELINQIGPDHQGCRHGLFDLSRVTMVKIAHFPLAESEGIWK